VQEARPRSASHGHLQPAASPARAGKCSRFRGSRHQSRRAAPWASSRLGRRLACVPTRGAARRGGPPWVRASKHPHHRRRHDGGLHQRTDSVLKHVQHRLRRRVRRWWTRIVLFRVRVSTLRPRHRLRRLWPSSDAALAVATPTIAVAAAALALAAAALAAAALALAAAAFSATLSASGSSVRRRRRIPLHRGCDLLLEGHVAHRTRRRGAWLHALRVGLPHADRLFVGTRL